MCDEMVDFSKFGHNPPIENLVAALKLNNFISCFKCAKRNDFPNFSHIYTKL